MFGKLATKLFPPVPKSTCEKILAIIPNGITPVSLTEDDTGTICDTDAPVMVSDESTVLLSLTKHSTIAWYFATLQEQSSEQNVESGHFT